ncbi:MAG: DUF561 domain-containing protein [Anaeroplasma sp.]
MLLNEILNIKYPIIQGAMANISDGKFAACVSNAGGLGIIASGAWGKDELRREIRICKENTKNIFGVNLMLMNPKVDELVDVIVEEHVAVVTTGAGSPAKYIERLKGAGCKIFPVVASVALAKRMERYEIDGLIAEGTESGGHVGEITTMALVPQVVKAVSVPVIAAGGIASGAQFNAALALGACGVQVGTIMLSSEECPIHQNYKDAVLNARDSDTTVTGRSVGAPVRILKNEMSRKYQELEKKGATKEELEQITLGSLRKAIAGDVKAGSVMLGQTAGIIDSVKPVAKILEDLIEESKSNYIDFKEKIDRLL